MKRLQIWLDDEWQWVFCVMYDKTIKTTKTKAKALKHYHLEWFQANYANHTFRLSK